MLSYGSLIMRNLANHRARVDNAPNVSYSALQEQSNLFELITDHVPALISYIDKHEHYLFSNNLYEEWLGLSKEAIYGKTVKQVRGNAAYKVIKPYLKKALAGEEVSYDNLLVKKDGSSVYINTRFVPHKNSKGEVEGIIGLVLDITDRKIAEDKLKDRERQFRHLVEANVIGVIIKSLDGPIYEANDIFLKMVGYTRADLEEGKVNWKLMTPPEYLKNVLKYEKEILSKGSVIPFEKEYLRKDGTRIPVLIGDVLLEKDTKKTITFILDMTKQKEVDQRKDEFIALASHELKTPLTSLKMYAQLIQHSSAKLKDERAIRLMGSMDKQIDKLTELVNDLLDVSRIQSGKLQYKKELFAFDKLIRETVEELQRVTKHTLIIEGQTKQKVRADRDRIKQVLTNLITNAVKYSPKGDKVILLLKTWENAVQVGVEDFGIGVPVELQKRIFDRFFQVERPLSHTYPGLGLGLYITREIIERHHGSIWVESKKTQGSTFYFTLPLHEKAAKQK